MSVSGLTSPSGQERTPIGAASDVCFVPKAEEAPLSHNVGFEPNYDIRADSANADSKEPPVCERPTL